MVPAPIDWSIGVLPVHATAVPTAVSTPAIVLGCHFCFARNAPTRAVPAAPAAVYASRCIGVSSSG
jgi:hypothetical protein